MMNLVVDYMDKLAEKDSDTYFIGIDGYRYYMTSNIQKKFPNRVIGAGISEQNAISMATGLALSGKTVYVFMIAAYATRRALDQFKFACYCGAKIRVITTLSGLSHPFAGFSHTAIDDVTVMKNSPNIEIVAQICFIFNISISELLDEKEELFLLDKKAIKKYQLLNEAGKKKADDYIDDLLENPKYQAKSLTEDQIATAVKEVIDSDSKDTGSLLFRLSHQEK